jgi:hypothetical protein
MIKDFINKNCNIFCHNLHNIGFLMNGKLIRAKSVCDAAIAESTVM